MMVHDIAALDLISSVNKFLGTIVFILREVPYLILNYNVLIMKSFFSLFNYHLLPASAKSLNDEIAMIIGSDSSLGCAFVSQVVKMHGTVVCVDESKLKGEALVKEINDSIGMTKAYFYECNLKQPNGITEIIQKVSKDVGDVTILVNCSIVNTVALYFNVFESVLPIMKGNSKGHLVFLRGNEPNTLNATQCLYSSVTEDLMFSQNQKVSTTLAHIYPKISFDEDGKNIFGTIKPETVASQVLDGVARKYPEIYLPGYMVYISSWFKFFPSAIVNMIEKFLFGDI